MSYLVLARKYRPQVLSEIVGQDAVIKTLGNAIENDRLSHAFLFTGSRGVGKTSVARAFSKSLVCQTGLTATPCNTCQACTEITQGTSIDVIEIDGASNTGVDDIRELRETIRYQPTSCRFKIIIIDEVHMLSTNAFNALLKTLEEPPAHVKFIFATTEPHKIPATILSRCQRYDFKRFSLNNTNKQLEKILKKENIKLKPEVVQLIAQSADGSMRDGLSLLDQALSFCTPKSTAEEVADAIGAIDQKIIFESAKSLAEKNLDEALKYSQKIFDRGLNPKVFLEGLASEFKYLAIAAKIKTLKFVNDLTEDHQKDLESFSNNQTADEWKRLFSLTLRSLDSLSKSNLPKLHIELLFLNLSLRPNINEVLNIAQEINFLKKNSETHTSSQPISKTATPKTLPKPLAIKKTNITLDSVDKKWLNFVDDLHNSMPMLSAHLEFGKFSQNKSDSKNLEIIFDKTLHFTAIEKEAQNPELVNLLAKHYGDGFKLKPVLISKSEKTLDKKPEIKAEIKAQIKNAVSINEGREGTQKKEHDDLREEIKNDPIINKALEIFGGEIKSFKKIK